MTAMRNPAKPATSAANKPTPSVVMVTPALAELWLAGNTVNRSIRDAAVNQYADDMLNGRWTLGPDAICQDADGNLLNGQHRLHAVLRSGCTVAMLVLNNALPESMRNMDTGRKRSVSDVLGFDGEENRYLLAAALKLAVLLSDGRIYRDRKVQSVSVGEMQDFLAENGDLRESVAYVGVCARSIDLTPTAKTVAHWLFSRAAGPDAAATFYELLSSRIGLPEGSPILALDSRLREMRKNRTRATHRDELFLLVKTWNYWRTDRRVKTIVLKSKASDTRIPTVAR